MFRKTARSGTNTQKDTHTHTDGHSNLETESAQWPNSVITQFIFFVFSGPVKSLAQDIQWCAQCCSIIKGYIGRTYSPAHDLAGHFSFCGTSMTLN